MTRPSAVALVIAGIGWLAQAAPADAHTSSTSYSQWTIAGRSVTVQLELSLLDHDLLMQRVDGAPGEANQGHASRARERLSHALLEGLRVTADGRACHAAADTFVELAAAHGRVAYEWQLECAAAIDELQLSVGLVFDVIPGHVHFAGLRHGDRIHERVLTGDRRVAAVDRQTQVTGVRALTPFFWLGVEHIMSGWDHLVFVLVLVVAARRLGQVALVVTGFTVGHSITLGLAASGHISADIASVEALIGLSIALVAIDGAWLTCARERKAIPAATIALLALAALLSLLSPGRGVVAPMALLGLTLFSACYFPLLAQSSAPQRWRGAIAALFGLLHGFGFAGALAPLPGATQLWSLAGFNLGVECGQLLVIALSWPVFVLARRWLGHERVTLWASSVALAIGVALFASRAFP